MPGGGGGCWPFIFLNLMSPRGGIGDRIIPGGGGGIRFIIPIGGGASLNPFMKLDGGGGGPC